MRLSTLSASMMPPDARKTRGYLGTLHRTAEALAPITDGRRAADCGKIGPDGQPLEGPALRIWQIVRVLVREAKAAGVSHEAIAAEMGITDKVLEKFLSPGDGLIITATAAFRLFAAEHLIGSEVLDRARATINAEWGMVAIAMPASTRDAARRARAMQAAACQVGAAAGHLIEAVAEAADERSPGGAGVTDTERAGIAAAAVEVHGAVATACAVATGPQGYSDTGPQGKKSGGGQ